MRNAVVPKAGKVESECLSSNASNFTPENPEAAWKRFEDGMRVVVKVPKANSATVAQTEQVGLKSPAGQ